MDFKLIKIESSPSPDLISAYKCWSKVWKGFIVENGHDMELYSDEFLLHDELVAVFDDDICVGLTLLSYINIENELDLARNYFDHWTELDIRRLKKYGSKVVLCTNFSILPEYRSKSGHGNIKDSLFMLSLNRLVDTNYDVLVGTMRCRAKMDQTGERYKGTVIKSGLDHPKFKEPISVVCFDKSDIEYFTEMKLAA